MGTFQSTICLFNDEIKVNKSKSVTEQNGFVLNCKVLLIIL